MIRFMGLGKCYIQENISLWFLEQIFDLIIRKHTKVIRETSRKYLPPVINTYNRGKSKSLPRDIKSPSTWPIVYNTILTEQPNLFSKDRVSRQVAQVYKLQVQSPKFCQNAAAARGPWPVSTDSAMTDGKRNTENNYEQ